MKLTIQNDFKNIVQIPLILIALLFFVSLNANAHSGNQSSFINLLQDPEVRILDISDHLYDGQFDQAEIELNALIADYPEFRLAHLMVSELMASKSGLAPGFDNWLTPENAELSGLIEEIRRRHAHRREAAAYASGKVPDSLIKLSASQKQVIIVDSSLSRAHVFEHKDAQLTLVGDYFITVGENGVLKAAEGDGRTPIGVYFITSRLDPGGLADLYGEGALPLNYPNEWDQRLGHSGYGIWLHGVPSNTYNRAPFATQGCVAFPNNDITLLYNTPDIENTPVIITQKMNWVDRSQNDRFQKLALKRMKEWRDDWASGNWKQIGRHYSPSFNDGSLNRDQWLNAQQEINPASRSFNMGDLSIIKYPNTPGLMVITFNKTYPSGNPSKNIKIRQYWHAGTTGNWRVIYEGPAVYEPIHFKGIPEAVRPALAIKVRKRNRQTNGG
jgi:murein L,D-transpeptidase YafK